MIKADDEKIMQRITEQLIEEIKDRIVNAVQPEKIILFGSYAYGTPAKDSDLDLLVIMPSFETMHKRIFRIRKLLRDFRVPKDVIVYTPQEVDNWKNVSNAGTRMTQIARIFTDPCASVSSAQSVFYCTLPGFICVHPRLIKSIFQQLASHKFETMKKEKRDFIMMIEEEGIEIYTNPS